VTVTPSAGWTGTSAGRGVLGTIAAIGVSVNVTAATGVPPDVRSVAFVHDGAENTTKMARTTIKRQVQGLFFRNVAKAVASLLPDHSLTIEKHRRDRGKRLCRPMRGLWSAWSRMTDGKLGAIGFFLFIALVSPWAIGKPAACRADLAADKQLRPVSMDVDRIWFVLFRSKSWRSSGAQMPVRHPEIAL